MIVSDQSGGERKLLGFSLIGLAVLLLLPQVPTLGLALGDDRWIVQEILTMVVAWIGVLASPILVAYSFKHRESRPRLFLAVFAVGLLYILWLDAVVVWPAYSLGSRWPLYVIPAAFFSVMLALVFPYRAWRWYLLPGGLLVLWGWRGTVPYMRWNVDKRIAMDLREIYGGTSADLQRVMGDYRASVHRFSSKPVGEASQMPPSGRIGDLDPGSIRSCSLSVNGGLGGVWIVIKEGKITRIVPAFD